MQIERASGNGGEDTQGMLDDFRFTVDPQPVPRFSAFRLAGSTMLRGGGIFVAPAPLEATRIPGNSGSEVPLAE